MRKKVSVNLPIAILCLAIAFSAGLGLSPHFGTTMVRAANPGEGRPKQFGLIEEVWNILQEDYVDKDALDPQKLAEGAIKGMVEALGDPHSAYLDAYHNWLRKAAFQGNFDGIGAEVALENKQVVITSVISRGPANRAGVRAGDRILAINGQPTDGMPLGEIVNQITGPSGTVVHMTLVHQSEDSAFDVEMTCIEIRPKTASSRMLRSGIGYVSINSFADGTTAEMEAALSQLGQAGARGIVLDLRDTPGGLLESGIEVASQFLTGGNVLYEVDGNGKTTPYEVKAGGIATGTPLVVLVNNGTISAAEVVAGAMQDTGRAVLVGTVTAGKGSVNWLRELSDGSALYVTIARWVTPNSRQIEGIGLSPDIVIERSDDDVANQRDPQLDKALEYLQGKVDSGGG